MATARRKTRAPQPASTDQSQAGDWEARLRVWIEIRGRGSLGPGKFKLLEAIEATRSLAAAARRLRMSYRLAWQHLRLIEQRTGLKAVERQRGGRQGGGSRLTPDGKALLDTYKRFCAEVHEHVQELFGRSFTAWTSRGRRPGQPPKNRPARRDDRSGR